MSPARSGKTKPWEARLTLKGPLSAQREAEVPSTELPTLSSVPARAGGEQSPAEPPEPAVVIPDEVAAIVEHGADAWRPFLKRYSSFILGCIRRFARDYDERMEIYVHVCRRLRADDCRRVRQFRGRGVAGNCKFSTWLAAVTFNMAREWIRSTRGRKRMFRAVQDLDRLDRLIFGYYFWEGYGISEIASSLRAKHFEVISSAQVMERLAAAESRLSSDHRWRLLTGLLRSSPPMSIDRPRSLVREDVPYDLPDVRSDPEAHASRAAARRALQGLIDDLPEQERLALQLKFGRGLSARAVAAALGIRNYKRIYEIQGRALARLAAELQEQGIGLEDFGAAWQEMDLFR